MRVITGQVKGMKLLSLPGMATRPTSDRVKEAIFDIIQFHVSGAVVLDLFAGSGQLGIEALSRGAKRAVFIDESREALGVVKKNLEKTRFTDKAEMFCLDYAAYLREARGKFDLIFLDPPYAGNYMETALEMLSQIDILSEDGIIICEHIRGKVLPQNVGALQSSREYHYGKTAVHCFSK